MKSLSESNHFSWHVGVLPFIWKPLLQPTNGNDIPDALPFILSLDNRTGVLVQSPNPAISKLLSVIYSKGSEISGMMENQGIGKKYADDFLRFIHSQIRTEPIEGSKILEIGCGTGYLLHRLQTLGAKCLGIEPGMHGQHGSKKYRVKIVNNFFPSEEIDDVFDIIIFYAVLEHIEDPYYFFTHLKSYLKTTGRVILSVPDCEPYMDMGDISFFLHQHWNYFTKQTLHNFLVSIGASDIDIQKAAFGGSLYACFKLTKKNYPIDSKRIHNEIEKVLSFQQRSEKAICRFYSFLSENQNRTVGIYVPGRIINALSIGEAKLSNYRFFDDNPLLTGTFFPGFNIPIEDRKSLMDNPTDAVIIMSHSFEKKIKESIEPYLPSKTCIISIREFFNDHE